MPGLPGGWMTLNVALEHLRVLLQQVCMSSQQTCMCVAAASACIGDIWSKALTL